jgi:dephospho-CoA kinase
VDLVVVVSAPAAVQAARVMRRPGMTRERLAAIRARQMPDAAKRRKADVVIHSGLSRHFAVTQLKRLLLRLREPG